MDTLARHLIAEFYRARPELLDSLQVIETAMTDAAEVIGATIVGKTFHKFAPQGVSGTVVIAESHLSVHTWPEAGYASVDIYTCGGLDPWPGFEHLAREFGASSYRIQEIVRGLPEDLEAGQPILPDDVQIISRDAELREFTGSPALSH